jgi:hypothetical protein
MANASTRKTDTKTDSTKSATDVAIQQVKIDDETLRSIGDFDTAMRVATEAVGAPAVSAADELGTGFELLGKDDKNRLVGVPFIAIQWAFQAGDYASEFVTMHVVTKDNARYIVNDGSTGIAQQLRDYTDRTGRTGNMLVPKGLVRSDYENEFGEGTTYYLSTSA